MFVALLAAGLLTHHVTYIIMYRSYLRVTFAPALGVHLPVPIFRIVQLLAIHVVVVLLVIGGPVPVVAAVAVYGLWASVQSLRISNHVWLAFLSIAVVGSSDAVHQVTEARLLLGTLYLIAGLAKFNGPFLFSEGSAARTIITLQAMLGGVPVPRFVLALSPIVVAVAESGAGVLLLAGIALVPVLVVCVVLHFTFGLVGNVHFALVALSLWSVALGCTVGSAAVIERNWWGFTLAFVVGAVSSWALKASLRPSTRVGLWASALLSGLYGVAALSVWLTVPAGAAPPGSWGVGATAVVVAMSINFILLLTGTKSEWSYVMFSNVRPYGRARILGWRPRWRAQYFAVDWQGGPSAAALAVMPENIRAQLKTGGHAFSGPVVRELVAIAATTGERMSVVSLEFDENGTPHPRPDMTPRPTGGPIWVAPVISRDATAAHLG